MRLVLGFSFCLLVLLADPVDIEQSELVQTESLHIVMVYHIKTQVEQRLVLAGLRFEQGTQGELEFVEHGFVDDTRTVDEVLEYVQYNPKKLVRQLEQWVTKSVRQGKISLEEGKEFLSNYRSGLYGYTYLE